MEAEHLKESNSGFSNNPPTVYVMPPSPDNGASCMLKQDQARAEAIVDADEAAKLKVSSSSKDSIHPIDAINDQAVPSQAANSGGCPISIVWSYLSSKAGSWTKEAAHCRWCCALVCHHGHAS